MADGNKAPGAPAPSPLLPSRAELDLRDRNDDKHDDEHHSGFSTKCTVEGESDKAQVNPTLPAVTVNERRSETAAPSTAFLKAFERLPDEIIQKCISILLSFHLAETVTIH